MMGMIVLAFLILAAVLAVSAYNRLIELRNRYKNAFSQIDVQLKRRYDLIPNLVETAKGYLRHERQTLEAVIAARNQAHSAAQRGAGRSRAPSSARPSRSRSPDGLLRGAGASQAPHGLADRALQPRSRRDGAGRLRGRVARPRLLPEPPLRGNPGFLELRLV